MGVSEGGLEMRALIAALFAVIASTASATTYDYAGNPYTSFSGLCNTTRCTSLSGYVTFNFDTSNFSGTLSLSSGDTAYLSAGIASGSTFGGTFYYPTYIFDPSYAIPPNPNPSTYYFSNLNGNFTLVNGDVISWSLSGGTGTVGCGGGPGCASAGSNVTSSPSGDVGGRADYPNYTLSATYDTGSNNSGGVWTNVSGVSVVPEPSTWAMLLIGFAAIGFAAHRRRRTEPAQV
jgi:hypothetical protein